MTSRVIIALDLGIRTGVAIGAPGEPPRVTAVTFKRPSQERDVAFGNLVAWLDQAAREHRPALVFKEAMLPLQAFAKLGNAEATVRLQAGLHAIVEAVCCRHNVAWDERADSTIRKHFLGRGRLGDRRSTKDAVIARCHALGLLPRTCRDDNCADAVAAHDWAAAHLMRVPPARLVLFGGEAA